MSPEKSRQPRPLPAGREPVVGVLSEGRVVQEEVGRVSGARWTALGAMARTGLFPLGEVETH